MDIIKLSKVAKDYYNSVKTPSLKQGWEKYVLTDGKTALFVGAAYQPKKGEVVFYLVVKNKNVLCQLYKTYEEPEFSEKNNQKLTI